MIKRDHRERAELKPENGRARSDPGLEGGKPGRGRKALLFGGGGVKKRS